MDKMMTTDINMQKITATQFVQNGHQKIAKQLKKMTSLAPHLHDEWVFIFAILTRRVNPRRTWSVQEEEHKCPQCGVAVPTEDDTMMGHLLLECKRFANEREEAVEESILTFKMCKLDFLKTARRDKQIDNMKHQIMESKENCEKIFIENRKTCLYHQYGNADRCRQCTAIRRIIDEPTEADANSILGVVEWGMTMNDLREAAHHMPEEKWLAYQCLLKKKLGHAEWLIIRDPFISYISSTVLRQQKMATMELAQAFVNRDTAALVQILKQDVNGANNRPLLSCLISPNGEVKYNMAALLYAAYLTKHIIPHTSL